MRKGKIILCLILALVLLLTACGTGTQPAKSTPGPDQKSNDKEAVTDKIIKIAIDTEPEHLSLSQSIDYVVVWCAKNINDFLVQYNQDMELELSIAKKLERIDGTTYEFEIHPGIKFHNGREVKADDVKFSLEYIIDPNSASGSSSYFTSLDYVEVTGDYTGIIHLKEPYYSFLNKLTFVPIIPKESAADLKTNPVGCGPYKFKVWNKDQNIQLVKNEEYWKEGYPKNDGITFEIMKEYTTIHNAFIAGEVDCILWSDFADVDTWESMDTTYPQDNTLFDSFIVVYNTATKPLDDARVRRAIALVIDKQQMIDMTSFGYGEVLDQPAYPGTYYYNKAASYSRNVEEAKRLMAEAGYPNGFSCSLLVPTTVQEGGCGDLLQAQLKEIGIEAALEKVEVGVFIDRVWGRKDFDITITGDGSDGDPETWLSRWFKTDADNNLGGYSNPKLDELIANANRSGTPEERKKYYDEAFELINEDMPITFLFGGHLCSALQKNVHGLVMYKNWWTDFYMMYKD